MKKLGYFLFFIIILVALTNHPPGINRERYECKGIILDKLLIEEDVIDSETNTISTKIYQRTDTEMIENKSKPQILKEHAELYMIYHPWGFWTSLLKSFTSGGLRVYETSMDIVKYYRVFGPTSFFFIEDKEGKRWGNFDLLKNTIYLGLPAKDGKYIAFSGTCERIF